MNSLKAKRAGQFIFVAGLVVSLVASMVYEPGEAPVVFGIHLIANIVFGVILFVERLWPIPAQRCSCMHN